MFKLDITQCVENLRKYYTCNKCGREYVFSNLQGRCCEKCDKPDGKYNKNDAFPRIIPTLGVLESCSSELIPTSVKPTRFTMCRKNDNTSNIECTVNEATTEKQNSLGEVPLHSFCKKRQLSKLDQCIRSNLYDINHKDFAGWTPLHEAVESDFMEGVEILLKHGALCDVPGLEYTTPLHKACMKQNERMIKLLIEYGADINSVDCWGQKPLDKIEDNIVKRKTERLLSREKHIVPKNVYVASPPRIFISESVDNNFKEKLNAWFPSYKLVPLKSATHLLMKGENLSADILTAVLKGYIVYDQNKMESFNQNDAYSLYFHYIPTFKPCFKMALLKRLLGHPPLFDKMIFHVLRHNKPLKIEGAALTTGDFIKLIEAGGGEVVKREPTPSSATSCLSAFHLLQHPDLRNCMNYIIFDDREPPQLLYNMKELHHKSSRWLVESIIRYRFV